MEPLFLFIRIFYVTSFTFWRACCNCYLSEHLFRSVTLTEVMVSPNLIFWSLQSGRPRVTVSVVIFNLGPYVSTSLSILRFSSVVLNMTNGEKHLRDQPSDPLSILR